MSAGTASSAESAVWASVEIALPPDEVLAQCRDLGTLLRLNPYLEVRAWAEDAGPFAPGKGYRLHAFNEWTGIERALELRVERADGGGFRIAYSTGLKHALEVRVDPHGEGGSALTLKEHYREPGAEVSEEALHREIDRSLTLWAVAVRRDALRTHRWGRFALYRGLRRFWLGMRPRERRIGRMLVWVSVL
ncbi:MAG: SRPBCC family protein, partial [Betaproteobacteria bacterium]|nr:SRPBCC family protein [Betaproteobacteria bacterium]